MYVFISHSSSDAARAQNICELLENGGHQCFIAPRDIRSGKEYAEELILGIERSDIIVLLMSNAANRSPHVLREVEHAASSGIPIMVYKLEEVELTKSMEYFLLTNQWVNQNPEEGIRKILKCVNDMQGEPEKNITRRLDMGSADAPAAPVKKNTQKKRRFQGRLPIADIYDALVTERPYKKAFSQQDAIEMIMAMTDELDITYMRNFLGIVILYPVNSIVTLSNGEKAKVLKNNPQYPLRPKVVGLRTGKVYDLSEDIKCASLIIE